MSNFGEAPDIKGCSSKRDERRSKEIKSNKLINSSLSSKPTQNAKKKGVFIAPESAYDEEHLPRNIFGCKTKSIVTVIKFMQ